MKKSLKIISIVLIMAVLLSTTAFAYDYRDWYTDEELEYGFEAGKIIFTVYIEYINIESIKSGAYEEILTDILPELEYKYIDSVLKTNIVVKFSLVLKENTVQAVLDAIAMLENNSIIKTVRPYYLSDFYKNLDVYEFLPGVFDVSFRQNYKGLSETEYLGFLTEIEDKIDHIEIFTSYTVTVYLKENTCDAVWEAIMALKDNPYVSGANVKLIYIDSPSFKYFYGDVNFDGKGTNADIVLIARYLTGLSEFNEDQIDAADVTRNGEVSNADVILLARYNVGL